MMVPKPTNTASPFRDAGRPPVLWAGIPASAWILLLSAGYWNWISRIVTLE